MQAPTLEQIKDKRSQQVSILRQKEREQQVWTNFFLKIIPDTFNCETFV